MNLLKILMLTAFLSMNGYLLSEQQEIPQNAYAGQSILDTLDTSFQKAKLKFMALMSSILGYQQKTPLQEQADAFFNPYTVQAKGNILDFLDTKFKETQKKLADLTYAFNFDQDYYRGESLDSADLIPLHEEEKEFVTTKIDNLTFGILRNYYRCLVKPDKKAECEQSKYHDYATMIVPLLKALKEVNLSEERAKKSPAIKREERLKLYTIRRVYR